VEEPRDADDLADSSSGRGAEPQLVEGGDARVVEHATTGDHGRHGGKVRGGVGERPHRLAGRELFHASVVRTSQHAAPECGAARQQVDPRHRVAVGCIAVRHQGQEVVEVVGTFGVDRHPARLDRHHGERRLEHDPRQPHPADCRPEQLRLPIWSDHHRRGVGEQQCQGAHVRSERAVDVMILAVDVAGDRSADRHESCAW
jgi:hypothetical protein